MKPLSVRQNFAINGIRLCLGALFPLITLPYASRVLHPEGIGKVNLALSVVAYFLMFASLGIPLYGLREAARLRDDKKALSKFSQEVFLFNGITSLVSIAAYLVVIFCVPKFAVSPAIFLIVGLTIPFTCIGFDWLYSALEQYAFITIRSFVFQCISLLCLFLFVHSESDAPIYAALSVFAGVGSNIANFIHVRKFIDFRITGKINLKGHVKPVSRLFLLSAAGGFYLYLTTIILGFLSGDASVGCYSTALKIVSLAQAIIGLSAVVAPRGSYLLSRNEFSDFRSLIEKTTRLSLMLLFPLTAGIILLAPELIQAFAGPLYASAVPVLRILVIKIIFVGISYITAVQVLIPQRRENAALVSYAIAAGLSVPLNFILIGKYDAIGAALSTTIVEGVVTIIQLYYCRDSVGKALFSRKNNIYIIGTLVVAISTAIIRWAVLGVELRIGFSAVTGILLYSGILLLAKEEIACMVFIKIPLIRNLIKRR